MKQKLLEIQREKAREVWEENKRFITKEDISKIFGITLPKVYRILKVGKQTKQK